MTRRIPIAIGAVLVGAAIGYGLVHGIGGHPAGDQACRGAVDVARKLAPLAHGEVAALTMATAPLRLPDLAFEDADGKPKKLSDWRGRTVLVNLWATWCVPCRKEMPALDTLQTKLGGPYFEVVAINIDTRDPEKPKNFLRDANLTKLGYFSDQKARVFQELKSRRPGAWDAHFGAGRRQGLRDRHHRRPCRLGERRRDQTPHGGGEADRGGILGRIGFRTNVRLRPMPAPDQTTAARRRAASEPRIFPHPEFDFMTAAPIWVCVLAACIARMPLTMLTISIRNAPKPGGTLPGRG